MNAPPTPQCVLRGHVGPVSSLCYSVEGGCLYSGDAEGIIKVWDLITRRPVAEFSENRCNVLSLCTLGPRLLASFSRGGAVSVRDVSVCDSNAVFTASTYCEHFCNLATDKSNRDENLIYSASRKESNIIEWDIRVANAVRTITGPDRESAGMLTSLCYLSATSGGPPPPQEEEEVGGCGIVEVGGCGPLLLAGFESGVVLRYDTRSCRPLERSLSLHPAQPVLALDMTAEGGLALSGEPTNSYTHSSQVV
jgi:hypothetical protein